MPIQKSGNWPQPMGRDNSTTQTKPQGKQEDYVGKKFRIPKGDFARFLGKDPQPQKQMLQTKHGNFKIPGGKVIAQAWSSMRAQVQAQFQRLGKNAAVKNADRYDKVSSAASDAVFHKGRPGEAPEKIDNAFEAMNEQMELGHSAGMRYLEMQYKFHFASRSSGTISNLMKKRHEAFKSSLSQVR